MQSGIGVVHNASLEDTLSPKPPRSVTHRTAATTGRLLADSAAAPRWSALPRIFAPALRG
ncbi:hypothetical protein [Streptomyces flaveolus]|uniref:hypothetical protein n=1 Tax=Streptomyces flaveolus TaxID=67297 RepID=UPI00331B11EE